MIEKGDKIIRIPWTPLEPEKYSSIDSVQVVTFDSCVKGTIHYYTNYLCRTQVKKHEHLPFFISYDEDFFQLLCSVDRPWFKFYKLLTKMDIRREIDSE